ncbi:MAG: hypothetical protein HC914_10700 [Chloroflexaceae bacterium]|nr:hypothetical protein [Chloroflexaceae bacterium]
MYSEELEWQFRLTQNAHSPPPVLYLPSAVIIHYEGRSSAQVPFVRHYHFQRSRLLLARLWYGSVFAKLFLTYLVLSYIWEILIESSKDLLGHRRDLRRQRIAVYAAVVSRLTDTVE